MVDHLTKLFDIGLPKTRREVLQIAENVATAKEMLKKHTYRLDGGDGFWSVIQECLDATAGVRIDAINEENLNKYFDLLEEVYNELDFKDHP